MFPPHPHGLVGQLEIWGPLEPSDLAPDSRMGALGLCLSLRAPPAHCLVGAPGPMSPWVVQHPRCTMADTQHSGMETLMNQQYPGCVGRDWSPHLNIAIGGLTWHDGGFFDSYNIFCLAIFCIPKFCYHMSMCYYFNKCMLITHDCIINLFLIFVL